MIDTEHEEVLVVGDLTLTVVDDGQNIIQIVFENDLMTVYLDETCEFGSESDPGRPVYLSKKANVAIVEYAKSKNLKISVSPF
jgi:hypothetical protein